MSSYSDLLTVSAFVIASAVFMGAAYQMVIEPGEFFSFIPRFFHGKGGFLQKLSSCGKCVAGWITFWAFWAFVPWSEDFTLIWVWIASVAAAITITGLINTYVQNRS